MIYFFIGRAVGFAVYADMAELADASALGADVLDVGVRVPLSAPNKNKTNPRENLEFVLFYTRNYFGLKIKR